MSASPGAKRVQSVGKTRPRYRRLGLMTGLLICVTGGSYVVAEHAADIVLLGMNDPHREDLAFAPAPRRLSYGLVEPYRPPTAEERAIALAVGATPPFGGLSYERPPVAAPPAAPVLITAFSAPTPFPDALGQSVRTAAAPVVPPRVRAGARAPVPPRAVAAVESPTMRPRAEFDPGVATANAPVPVPRPRTDVEHRELAANGPPAERPSTIEELNALIVQAGRSALAEAYRAPPPSAPVPQPAMGWGPPPAPVAVARPPMGLVQPRAVYAPPAPAPIPTTARVFTPPPATVYAPPPPPAVAYAPAPVYAPAPMPVRAPVQMVETPPVGASPPMSINYPSAPDLVARRRAQREGID